MGGSENTRSEPVYQYCNRLKNGFLFQTVRSWGIDRYTVKTGFVDDKDIIPYAKKKKLLDPCNIRELKEKSQDIAEAIFNDNLAYGNFSALMKSMAEVTDYKDEQIKLAEEEDAEIRPV